MTNSEEQRRWKKVNNPKLSQTFWTDFESWWRCWAFETVKLENNLKFKPNIFSNSVWFQAQNKSLLRSSIYLIPISHSRFISYSDATLWHNSSKVSKVHFYWSEEPIWLTSAPSCRQTWALVGVVWSVNKCLIMCHYLFIIKCHIALRARISSSFLNNESRSNVNMSDSIIHQQYCAL